MKLILRLLLLLFSVTGSLRAANDPVDAVHRFKESLKTVDRLVVIRTEWDKPKDGDQGKIVLEIKETEVIAMLGDTLEIKKFDMHCLCLESPEIHFYQGENYRFSLTLHHSNRLRGEDGALGGDAELTEQSAERFRSWFARNGYDGFVKRYEAMLKAITAEKIRKEKFLELFPEPTRSLFPTEEEEYNVKAINQKTARFTALYSDRSALILDCWRGLGTLPRSYDSGWDREWQDYLRNLLHSLADAEIRVALERLPVDDDRVWIGAFRYSEYSGARGEERMATLFTTEWLARLAKRAYPLADQYESRSIIDRLAKHPATPTDRLLLEIGESGQLILPISNEDGEVMRYPWLPNSAAALLALAKNQIADSRPVILRRLTEATDPEIRLILEVALAQFDGAAAIKPAHLQSKFDEVAEMAWRVVSNDPNAQISIETLAVLAAKSKSYRVRDAAAEKLEVFGLRVMTDEGKAAGILGEPRFKQAKSVPEIDARIAEIKKQATGRKADKIERDVLAVLNHRKGRLLMETGNFDQAAPLLIGGSADRNLYADHAFALQTLGRFDDSSNSLGRSVETRDEEAVTARLVRRGYLAFAQGHFEYASANFAAAKTVSGYLRDQGPVTLIQYLSDLLAGKQPEVPSTEHVVITDSGFEESEGSAADASWPETASFFIRGEVTETDVFSRIEKQKWEKEKDLCEAHFFFSALSRGKGDSVGEIKHLQSALETKAFTTQCFSLATVRFRELSAGKKLHVNGAKRKLGRASRSLDAVGRLVIPAFASHFHREAVGT